MKILGYSEITVKLLRYTDNPKEILEMALNMTMKQNFTPQNKDISRVIKYIIDANHTSPLEHIYYTFLIKGATRSFLAQITRHRIASYTSGSQHYQKYSDYNFKISDTLKNNLLIKDASNKLMDIYNELINQGISKEEARQILPNGMENNLLFTINARSLINFLNLRLCYRNTSEIQIVSEKILKLLIPTFPELWNNIGPDCYMKNKCYQGKMGCNKKWCIK